MRNIPIFSLIILCILTEWVYPAHAADPIPITPASISITKGPFKWNKSTSQWETVVTLKNVTTIKNNKKFYGPFQLVPHFDREDVELLNSGGLTADSKPYVQVNVPKEGLAPGQKIKKIPLQFKSESKKRFKLNYHVLGYTSPQGSINPPKPPPVTDLPFPTDMNLDQVSYKDTAGVIRYDLDVSWKYAIQNVRFEVNWQIQGDGDQWQKADVAENTYNFKITNVQLNTYKVRIRAIDLTTSKASEWNIGEIDIQFYDYPPGPPINLQVTSSASGIRLSWNNPVDSDFSGIEIWTNNANTRGGLMTKVPPVPPARLLTRLGKPATSFVHVPDDRIWHYYWIRAYDSENGVTPSQYSSWERAGDSDGVRGRQGIFGDGNPPPAPISLQVLPGTWTCTLNWRQSQAIPDIFGTEIYFSLVNDISKSQQLGVTTDIKATHFPLESSTKYYYWVRNVDIENQRSEFYPSTVKGVECETLMSMR